tara:strand:+ start:1036 stop:1182 length:147 start_codon:yes stop_codon:yes gene_type:complete
LKTHDEQNAMWEAFDQMKPAEITYPHWWEDYVIDTIARVMKENVRGQV